MKAEKDNLRIEGGNRVVSNVLRFHSNELEHFLLLVKVGRSVEWDLSGPGTS